MECTTIILSIITVASYIALAIITFFYMRETRRIREIAIEDLKIGASPKVFVSSVDTIQMLDESRKKISIRATMHIRNTGRTEANNLIMRYKLLIGDLIQVPWEVKEAPFIFPGQNVILNCIPYEFDLSEEEIRSAKSQLENNKIIVFPVNSKPLYKTEVKLEYLGYWNERIILTWLCEYSWDVASWGMEILGKE